MVSCTYTDAFLMPPDGPVLAALSTETVSRPVRKVGKMRRYTLPIGESTAPRTTLTAKSRAVGQLDREQAIAITNNRCRRPNGVAMIASVLGQCWDQPMILLSPSTNKDDRYAR